jgi:cell wall-associated NlpC family hydrolase
MTTARMSNSRRFPRLGRRSLVAAIVGAGVVLTPLPAMASTSTATAASAETVATSAAQTVVDTAMAQRGKPYVWAGSGPASFDCSGLTQFAYKVAGVNLPRTTGAQATVGTPVSRANLQPGDLVFFYNGGHVGIYIGNGQIVHAPTAGDVVKVTNIDYMGPLAGARHIV